MKVTIHKGFFDSLFDFSFSSFIATKMIRILYALLILFSALAALVLIVKGFSMGLWKGLASLVISPLLFLLYVILGRIWLEALIVFFRIAEHVAEIKDSLREKQD